MNDPVLLTALAVILLLVVVVVAVAISRRRRHRLAERFGPEYEHAVATHGRRRGERELEARQQHLDELHLHELTAEERSELVRRWDRVQARFVDQPVAAVSEADELIAETMRRRGYPLDEVYDPERREADLSAAHPHEVSLYRDAAAIARRSRDNQATTEELRQAMVHYRTLFETLSGRTAPAAGTTAATAPAEQRPVRPGEAMPGAGAPVPRHDAPRTEPAVTRHPDGPTTAPAEPRATHPGEAAYPDGPTHGDGRVRHPETEPREVEHGEPVAAGGRPPDTPRRRV
ncbi:MAG TPA: hypothetical protein VF100_05620 [Thermoanaerobaculia bacterium]